MSKWSISGGTILTPEKTIKKGSIVINNGKFSSVSADGGAPINLDAGNCVIVPGLINAHDHLLGTYYPKIGNGPYINWLPWDNDLKSSPIYEERCQIENRDLYLLGAYRNLVSGVTLVSDHMPHFVGDQFYDILPTRAIKKFALSHSVASFALAWGDGITVEYKKALKENIPYVTHIAEGFDDETKQDLKVIDRLGGLGDHSVFIHCIAFSDDDLDLVRERGASCVWCCDSNMFMYNKTMDAKKFLKKGINLCIGTDSSATGGETLLYEMKYDKMIYHRLYGEDLADDLILKMVTVNPARAFRRNDLGRIEEGCTADLCLFRDRGGSPAGSIVNAHLRDVMLVVIDGRPVYGDAAYAAVFDDLGVAYSRVVMDGVDKIVIGDPAGLLRRISRAVGFKKEFPFLPIDFDI
ncbi:MAG TPA: amidohydrolase family protein [Spirochaetota bacterium]|nr:amidohydrolase family protein [Spirochaetota bacterium]HPC40991.1 amidohydrolase family protein [Spirochaetota bacterium]HPL17603.1 amidohydrolase family protein [Spirochaetota bacterium]HQF08896.1 amidohydrolase family protein [Spirochaetota bacterium]HQH97515.1 amidohydrolase family protein [Spirochaetota bacterium]